MTLRTRVQKAQNLKASKDMFLTASQLSPGGVHSNYRFQEPHPRYYAKASGAYIWDVDGNRYVDCIVNAGACVLGHGYPKVTESVMKQLSTGITVGLETELSIDVAKMVHKMVPSAEVVKFSNSGTEAVMHAIQMSRGYSGKDKVAKLEGGFNGWYDFALVSTHPDLELAGSASEPASIPGANGLSRHAAETVIVPFNDIDHTSKILKQHKDELAALIIEPVMFNMGCIPPKPEYLKAVREMTEEYGIILIFDEVISGFRMAPGGAQQYYGVLPDLSTFAKAMANGFPLSAVVGRKDIIDVTNPHAVESRTHSGGVSYFGTYNANQMSLAAARATLSELESGRIQKALHERSRWLSESFEALAGKWGVQATLVGLAGKFGVYFMKDRPIDYRTAMKTDVKKYAIFRQAMLENGIMMHPGPTSHHGLTWSHKKETLDDMVDSMDIALKHVKQA